MVNLKATWALLFFSVTICNWNYLLPRARCRQEQEVLHRSVCFHHSKGGLSSKNNTLEEEVLEAIFNTRALTFASQLSLRIVTRPVFLLTVVMLSHKAARSDAICSCRPLLCLGRSSFIESSWMILFVSECNSRNCVVLKYSGTISRRRIALAPYPVVHDTLVSGPKISLASH